MEVVGTSPDNDGAEEGGGGGSERAGVGKEVPSAVVRNTGEEPSYALEEGAEEEAVG